ncbi:hypothetical protein [Streptomyces sp. UNOC14_S4]|nr:hypothetical protein [Streptomyces sp. UNOC14_S4]MCC3767826.1 hypothetical protein [Streptomyces sp. UNOC14_S4]
MPKPLLFLLYYLVVTPVGIVMRMTRDPLARHKDPRARSYWTPVAGRE